MTRALYLVGPPGVGKTTLMTLLLSRYQVLNAWVPPGYGPLRLEPLIDGGGMAAGYHLGITRAAFGGTDALSMGVNTAAVRWVSEAPLPGVLYGEGQRLANMRFLTALADQADLTVVHLTAPVEVLDARCDARGSKQDPAWRKAGRTRAANVARDAAAAGIRVSTRDATRPPEELCRDVEATAAVIAGG